MHARYQKSRGRNLSATLALWRNPFEALKMAESFAYFPPTINLQGAKKVAEIFCQLDKVQAVEVFGSVARSQEGNDLDLILVCDEETSQLFMERVEFEAKLAKLPRIGRYHGYALTRSNIAEEILNPDIGSIDSDDHLFEEALAACEVGVDIFIFPPNWRNRLDELQGRMEHDDPKFMAKIAKDARRIA
jgi:predicted nucleotidyltransferase